MPDFENEKYLIVSGHDFRSKRKASVHFIADELSKIGRTRFFSIGFSWVSRIKKDPRKSLWNRVNEIQRVREVDCYLWKSFIHPVNLHSVVLQGISERWFNHYIDSCPQVLVDWIRSSQTVLLESGMAPIFFELVQAINPQAKIIYLCSDALETISCSPFIVKKLESAAPKFHRIRIPSRFLASEFPLCENLAVIPHGMNPIAMDSIARSPYGEKKVVVSVGQMLFDPGFFKIASAAFPDIEFHIIGGGLLATQLSALDNVKVHDEMPYQETLKFIKYAAAGVAAYQGSKVQAYLADTSLKLRQFAAFGLPALCPAMIVSGYSGRYGYVPDEESSIIDAVKNAIEAGPLEPVMGLQWNQVVEQLIDPNFKTLSPSAIFQ